PADPRAGRGADLAAHARRAHAPAPRRARARSRRTRPAGGLVTHLRTVCSGLLAPFLLSAVSYAQEAAEERSTSFQAVKGAVKEAVPGGPLLVYAYGLILFLLIAYLIRLVLLQQRNERELSRLSELLGKTGS